MRELIYTCIIFLTTAAVNAYFLFLPSVYNSISDPGDLPPRWYCVVGPFLFIILIGSFARILLLTLFNINDNNPHNE